MFSQRVVIAVFVLGGLCVLRPQPAHASGWGCQVILCISNPGGPEQYAACVPPMQRLYDVLAHDGSFPTCSEGGTVADPGYEPPYFCPQGSTPAGDQQRGSADLAGCYYTDPKIGVTYLLAPTQNPYTMNVSVHWQGGSETIYIDPAADRSTLTTPQPPPVTAAMLATAIQISNSAAQSSGGN